MREFKLNSCDIIVDLDNTEIYDYLPNDVKQLDEKMFSEIGMALCYMNIWHPDIWGKPKMDGGQKKRVMKMIRNFCRERKNYYGDILWLKEQIFLFQEETENMC